MSSVMYAYIFPRGLMIYPRVMILDINFGEYDTDSLEWKVRKEPE